MNYLHLNDTTLPRRVRRSYDNDIVILVLMPSEPQRNLHTFISFVEELLTHLPRQEYVNLIKDKCEKSAIFAKFYQALRSSEFIPMIEQAMVTQNVKNLISTLNSNFIDAHSLKNIAFEVISWGPVTQNVKNLISTLNSNSIDAHSLVKIFSKVISWGPTICIFKKLK
uniref:GK21601 n=1 Tax=Drosophila willistoni TaxID=7260 RepID=B4MPH0_DROWI